MLLMLPVDIITPFPLIGNLRWEVEATSHEICVSKLLPRLSHCQVRAIGPRTGELGRGVIGEEEIPGRCARAL